MNPYREGLAWISQSPDTASAMGLAKLILSLWDSQCAFPLSDCLSTLGGAKSRLAMRIANHYAEHGPDDELAAVGQAVREQFPRLWVLGQVMTDAARQQARVWWRESRDAENARRQPGQKSDDE